MAETTATPSSMVPSTANVDANVYFELPHADQPGLHADRSLQEQPYDYSSPHVRAFAATISKDWQEMEGIL